MSELAMKNLNANDVSTGVHAQPKVQIATSSGRLRIKNVEKRYGAVRALAGVSLEVSEGSFVALLGPSGCGKTTLLNAIAGFTDIDAGSIEIAGRALGKSTPPHQRNLGMVFQHYALFPHMTVRRNIAFPLEIRRISSAEIERQVDRALAMVDLAGLQDRYPAEMSGGQQQRVALARALVYSPPVLLLDEPLGALDRRLRDVMQAELKDLHRRLGKTFIYVTHDQDEALAMADVVVVMRDGRVEQMGSPLDLYERPSNSFVAKFVGECNILSGSWRRTDGFYELVEASSGMVLHRCKGVEQPIHCAVAIRPEWMQLRASDEVLPQGTQAVHCQVTQSRFHGSETFLDVSSSAGELQVRVPHWLRKKLDLTNVQLCVGWDPTQTVLLTNGAA